MTLGHRSHLSHLDGATRTTSGPATPAPRDRGAALVEFVLIATLLVTMVFGALDIGFQWRFAHEATSASRSGARYGARLGNEQYADLNILATVRTTLEASGTRAELSRVVIYRANTDGLPPASCMDEFSPSGACNVYPRDVVNFGLTEDLFDDEGCMISGARHSGWCPADRDSSQMSGDTLGVMVVVDTQSITGLFPSREASRHTAMRIEPNADTE